MPPVSELVDQDSLTSTTRGFRAFLPCRAAGLITLADKGYQGSTWGEDPLPREEQAGTAEKANRAYATLRAPGERANAQLKTWRILRKLRCCP